MSNLDLRKNPEEEKYFSTINIEANFHLVFKNMYVYKINNQHGIMVKYVNKSNAKTIWQKKKCLIVGYCGFIRDILQETGKLFRKCIPR